MLPKKERLTKKDFSRFFSMGKRFNTSSLQVIYSPNSTLHVSVSVSKKVHKTAVKRNKLRRQIYDMVRRYHKINNLNGVYIIIPKTNSNEVLREELQEELIQIIQKINS